MENKSSECMFSFQGTPEDDPSPNEFEFGCITPTSPSSDPSKTVSPADQFFLNGRLLPHSFPVPSRRSTSECSSRSATTSRTSSTGSKDSLSLLSSRSNSTNSSRSGTTCNSARTSASDVSERKVFQRKLANTTFSARERVYAQGSGYYGSSHSQRWQFITPAPVLGPSLSRRRRRSSAELKLSPNKNKGSNSVMSDERLGFCQRVLRSFVKSCKACHAMEGAAVEDDDFESQLEIK